LYFLQTRSVFSAAVADSKPTEPESIRTIKVILIWAIIQQDRKGGRAKAAVVVSKRLSA